MPAFYASLSDEDGEADKMFPPFLEPLQIQMAVRKENLCITGTELKTVF